MGHAKKVMATARVAASIPRWQAAKREAAVFPARWWIGCSQPLNLLNHTDLCQMYLNWWLINEPPVQGSTCWTSICHLSVLSPDGWVSWLIQSCSRTKDFTQFSHLQWKQQRLLSLFKLSFRSKTSNLVVLLSIKAISISVYINGILSFWIISKQCHPNKWPNTKTIDSPYLLLSVLVYNLFFSRFLSLLN